MGSCGLFTSIFGIIVLVNIIVSQTNGTFISKRQVTNPGSLQDDFVDALIEISRTLPKKKLCLSVGRFVKNPDDPIIKKIWYEGRLNKRKFSCDKYKVQHNAVLTEQTEDQVSLMSRLYNQLPLPFQCHVLTMVTLKYHKDTVILRKEHISNDDSSSEKRVPNSLAAQDDFVKASLMYHGEELLQMIEDTENALSSHAILPVAKQCKRLINKHNAFSKVIQLTVKRNVSNVLDEDEIDDTLRATFPGIVETYVRENGIRIGLSLIDGHWIKTLQSLIFISIKEQNRTPEHLILNCKMFLALGNTGPISANLILAALYYYGKERLAETTGLDISFDIVLDEKSMQLPYRSIQDVPDLQQQLFMKQTFPKYLDRYFKRIDTVQQSYLLDLVSTYSNQTKPKLIAMLENDRGLQLSKLTKYLESMTAKKRIKHYPNQPSKTVSPLNPTHPKTNKSDFRITQQLTNVEIIMVAALACLVVFGCAFIGTFIIFHQRRKEFNKKVIEIQSRMYKDTRVTLQKQSSSSTDAGQLKSQLHQQPIVGSSRETLSIAVAETTADNGVVSTNIQTHLYAADQKSFKTFCTRTRKYSIQNNKMKVDSFVRNDMNCNLTLPICEESSV